MSQNVLDVSGLPEAFVAELHEAIESVRNATANTVADPYLPNAAPAERAARFRAWAGRCPGGDHVLDSREAIYSEAAE